MSVLMVQVIPDGITHYFLTLTNKQTCLPFEFVMVEPRGIGGAAHQQGFSEHSLRKPLARANAQPAFATFPRQPSRVRFLGSKYMQAPG